MKAAIEQKLLYSDFTNRPDQKSVGLQDCALIPGKEDGL
jgi:hypothetical protein